MAYIRTITFNYNANGGSGAPASSTNSYSISSFPATRTKGISSTKPSRTYYNFLGWAGSSGATSATWASGQELSFTWPDGNYGNFNQTFYAVWQHQTAYVYYNANGGSGAPSTQSHWAGYSVTLSATKPTRAKYIFLGWSQSSTATTASYQPNTAYNLYNTVTLYAVWKKASDTVSTPAGTMGSAMTLTITKVDPAYKDDITYQFGSATGTIATGTTLSSISWTPPTTLASEIPNASSGSLVITCKTYEGTTLVGTTTTTVTLSVPQSLAPSASVSFADTDATCLGWGVYVQSRSKLSFTITASGQESATIASYRTTVNGTQYTGATFTTDVLLYNGSNTYTTVVTDSRGLQTTVTGTFNVVAYSVPSLTLTLCDRDDSDDSQINIEFDFTVASVSNNNDANYRLDYKLKSSSTWTNGTVTSLGGYSGTITDAVTGRDGGDEWDIRINVIDSFQTTSITSEVGVSGNILLNSRHAGGLGLLMKSQAQNQLDVGKHTVFHETTDVIPRRAYATLSSAGWYRVCTSSSGYVNGGNGAILDFHISKASGAETHSVTLRFTDSNNIKFVDEVSRTYTLHIDKIRYTFSGSYGYVDIHFTDSSSHDVCVSFDVYESNPSRISAWESNNLEAVADAPVGETVVTTYTFSSNGFVPNEAIINLSGYNLQSTGAILYKDGSSTSVPNNTWKEIASLALSEGRWLLYYTVRFDSNNSGIRETRCSTTSGSSTSTVNLGSNMNAVTGAQTFLKAMDFVTPNASTTYYLNAYQNSGSSISAVGRLYAIKIA